MPVFNALGRGEPLNSRLQNLPHETRDIVLLFYGKSEAYFDIMKRLGVTNECDNRQIRRRTDIVIANAALHYVVRPKTLTITR